jgi:hypothetical protein
MEEAVEYFSLFGGLDVKVDTKKEPFELIEELILKNYDSLHQHIINTTLGDSVYHALLSGVAMGDGRIHSALKRARISSDIAKPAMRYLCQSGLIWREDARPLSQSIDAPVPDKLHFSAPFLRVWFALVSPLFKGISTGDYSESKERFANKKQEFFELVFRELSQELLKTTFKDDPIVEIGGYWDAKVDIDIMATTTSGRVVVATCKYSNAKIKKSELSKLQHKCDTAGIKADVFVLISKRGFSNELKALKGEALKLLSVKNFKNLIKEIEVEKKL